MNIEPIKQTAKPQDVLSHSNSVKASYRLGELFCGAGGMALGASEASYKNLRFEHAWVTDIDKDSCLTIRENEIVDSERILEEDVRTLNFRSLADIDGLVFGFPCNDFSTVGKRRGIEGKYGDLYQFGVKALNELNPMFFVAENVSGLSSVNKRGDFNRILNELENAGEGYSVVENLYKFENYGIPQTRHRYMIIGFRQDLNIRFKHPEPNFKTQSVKVALSGIPHDATNHEKTIQSKQVIERLKHIEPGQNAFTADLPPRLRLNMRSGAKISQIYRRLLPDKPSYTVTGSGGGGTHVYHWEEPRALTNRERARLQTFPDWYRFEGGKESVRRQIGMAVPPTGARIVFQSILRTLVDSNLEAGIRFD
ncbi:MAG: DNA (cytosine-5-)-methyltransferase [Gammaproteobacteria bacterium]|nr:DNA (cytosine-5-)-methyltransferase [Gammaproteobacteria bacterium]